MDALSNLPAWHRELSSDDVAIWREWAEMTGIYAPAWVDAYFGAQNVSGPATRRQLRQMRQGRAPMRIRVNVIDRRPGVPSDEGAPVVDSCDVYGWRAALAAVRALRTEYDVERYSRHFVYVLDAKLSDAVDSALYGE
jgi:hypothetical protein